MVALATAALLATGGCSDSKVGWDINGKLMSIRLDSPFPLELRRIDPEPFVMGGGEAGRGSVPDNEKPAHEVKIREPYFIAVHETTNEHFRQFRPQHDSKDALALLEGEIATDTSVADLNDDRHPVVGVSHEDAEAFCEWLSKRSGLTVRLPSEAEWEFACNGSQDTAYSWGDARPESTRHANLAGAATAELLGNISDPSPREDGKQLTARVASFQPSPNGLFDMHGNVAEWCQDVYRENYNNASPEGEPNTIGSDTALKVVRGGSWASGMDEARSGARESMDESSADAMTGFRIVVEMPDGDDLPEGAYSSS